MKKNKVFKFKVDKKSLTDSYGLFTLEPLERGYGITIGNALRRVLLTSMPGVAIISVKIDGILHEFATIEGVKEDMADVILNLKKIRFKTSESTLDKVALVLKGPGTFIADDIDEASEQFEVLNRDQYVATMNKDANFTMELQIGIGKGYIDADNHQRIDETIGTIYIDSIFNPVLKVSYDVVPGSSAKDSFEKLILEINTDGASTPMDSVNYGASVLIDHFKHFLIPDALPVLEITEKVDDEVLRIRALLNQSIEEMELSVRSHNCLQAAGIKVISDLVSKSESEMLKYKNFGRKSLSELVEKLAEMGLTFGMNVEKYKLESDK
ncbi:MAG: DNA-directed RNA polymerase subunit alpha [Candidatus Marinimicrobia bacterium]|nr:DNA-directed RNA polymerase subunit alpha [Candidatus Neomarinimicrobiota bacterium]MBL7046378.1 DNA-directed RNA polymerase subunit alpha [Candidatus Neomarinimicrobiota bacterium]